MTTILQLNQEDLRNEIKTCLRESIEEIRNIPIPNPLPDRITIKEACEITGLSRSLIYKMSMNGSIPKEKYGKRLVFSRKTLLEWIQTRTVSELSPDVIMTRILTKASKKRF